MKYKVILADPPWKFKTYSRKGLGRSAESYYDCLSVNEIAEFPISELSDNDCVLFLWVTDPFLFEARKVIEAWGFTYKTVGFYWVKSPKNVGFWGEFFNSWPIGTGYWTRANPELCLLATKGHPKRIDSSVHKLLVSPREEHSKKPDEVYNRIEKLCEGPYVELFSRQIRYGWDVEYSDEAKTGISKRRWSSSGKDIT